MMLSDAEFEFMSDPEHARWLKDHVEDKFWLKFESLSQARVKGGLADGEASGSLACWPASPQAGGE
jgi:hypothetical protein